MRDGRSADYPNIERQESQLQDTLPNEPDTLDGEDARNDEEALKRNRERLGVDEEHKTPEMQEQGRGTYP